jgi:hypothetical protein
MRPITVSVGPLAAAAANNIALSQTPAGAGALILNGSLVTGGVATLDNPRRILITTADTTHTFTVTGLTPARTTITEAFVVAGGATFSQLDYAKVTSITISGAATAAVTVGTNGVASTPWVRFDDWAPAPASIQCTVSGTVNYTVQQTMDDPNSATNAVTPSAVTWVATSDTAAVNATISLQTNYAYAPVFARVLLNSGTGTVTATFLQSSSATY